MNTVFCRNTKNIIIMDSSYSVLGMGKARPVCRALVGGVYSLVNQHRSSMTVHPQIFSNARNKEMIALFSQSDSSMTIEI